jgi:hypothetical protein
MRWMGWIYLIDIAMSEHVGQRRFGREAALANVWACNGLMLAIETELSSL